ACARVVAPTIESPACQEQLTSAAKQVARAVEELLVDAQAACSRSTGDGQRSLGDIHEAARQMEAEADRAPERRDRLLDAARSVAQATSRMIDATKVNFVVCFFVHP
uniref:Vinculin n=1 Tax=Parascaris equorum TaxID=6256 RepID=A0A914S8M5_PAREQ